MADDSSELDYIYLAQNALRGVVRDVLAITEDLGFPPGDHHYYIEFLTRAPGVILSDRLLEQYPERMTIVLQNQFKDLSVSDHHFQVTLSFQNIPAHLSIPYDAVTQFSDPSAKFVLQFPSEDIEAQIEANKTAEANSSPTLASVETLASHRTTGVEPSLRDDAKAEPSDGDDDPDGSAPDTPSDGGGSADIVSLDRFRKK